MAVGTLDQHQDTATTGFGHGETAGARYRGQVWTSGLTGSLGSVGFNRAIPSAGIRLKVYIDTVDGSNFPAHAVGSELYSWIIANASIPGGYTVFDLPTPLAGLVSGTKYCFYTAPWHATLDQYADDYKDNQGLNSVSGGVTEITNTNGTWSTENLTFNYAVYVSSGNSNFFTFFR